MGLISDACAQPLHTQLQTCSILPHFVFRCVFFSCYRCFSAFDDHPVLKNVFAIDPWVLDSALDLFTQPSDLGPRWLLRVLVVNLGFALHVLTSQTFVEPLCRILLKPRALLFFEIGSQEVTWLLHWQAQHKRHLARRVIERKGWFGEGPKQKRRFFSSADQPGDRLPEDRPVRSSETEVPSKRARRP